jgi:hypothetical protein
MRPLFSATADFVGILPDGKHYITRTKHKRAAFVAECDTCGQGFGSDDPLFTIAQSVAAHGEGTRHLKFNYFELEVLATGATLGVPE